MSESTIIYSVRIWTNSISPCSTLSFKKWYLMSMHLLFLWYLRFFDKVSAELLSEKLVVNFLKGTRSRWSRKRFNQIASYTLATNVTYLNIVNKATQVCFLLHHKTASPHNVKTFPKMGLLPCLSFLRSTPTYPLSRRFFLYITMILWSSLQILKDMLHFLLMFGFELNWYRLVRPFAKLIYSLAHIIEQISQPIVLFL